ncbi:MAG: HsdR family type I site-specific deoxyribonuclease [Candidatus Aureabacteria bacterium]|nr:HsdR family type I site-specific deoxyribonuclease [Candidatus Auribacterota bacterium]
MSKLTETDIELFVIELLENQGFTYLSPEKWEIERGSLDNVILCPRLQDAIDHLNPGIPAEAKEQAVRQILNLPSQNLIENNEVFQRMLTDGVRVEFMTEDGIRGADVRVIDFDETGNNDFVQCNQFTVINDHVNKRPDVVLFVNGLPLVVIELKNPVDEKATVKKAFTQLQNYKNAIPALFPYNGLLIASDGLDAKAGSLTAGFSRFMAWKTRDGLTEVGRTIPQIETLIKGMLNQKVLLDLIRQFTVFEKERKEDKVTGIIRVETIKKIAAYHQYYAVKKAVESTRNAASDQGDRKVGVIWHAQGSGKSLSMVFYTGEVVLKLSNPTIVVITDRNDLDDQLFNTFAGCSQLLRQEPVQAGNRGDLKKLLKTAGGGIVFTTIQKFFPEDGREMYDCLSERKNIIVIADEAHRSHYGFKLKVREKNGEALHAYGFAKYLRDALPNASFIGFTGTPVEKQDVSTRGVFGDEIDIYDMHDAQKDEVTVKIYYESRLAKIHLKPAEKELLDEEVSSITENEESEASQKAKAKWTQLEAIVGHPERIKDVAKDILSHFEAKQEAFEGKAMIVAMSRRIAVALYGELIKLKPAWHDKQKANGEIKVVMTSSSSDSESWQMHHTTKQDRKNIADRFKDPTDKLKMVIVRDMWLTGFDVPCLHTMYVDKPMKGHNLMQAIARVNRVFKDKPGGLIVDYIGIASDLKHALSNYTQSGGKGKPMLDQSEAVALMHEKIEVVEQMFSGFDYERYFKADPRDKMVVILEAQEHVLCLDDGKNRFIKHVTALSKAFALSVPHPEAFLLKEKVGFFQAVKARLIKFEPAGSGKSDAEIETAIRQIVDRAIVSEGVVNVFDAAGIKKPDISILSDEFLEEVRGMVRKNVALELLKKLLNDEISIRSKRNLVQGRKLSEMLECAINKYQNNLLTSAQVIEELIQMAKEIREADKRGDSLGLSEDELAFYDAVADNESARDMLGNEILKELACLLVKRVKSNASIDWTIKESVRAKLRSIVKRTLRKFGYPPDKTLLATENVLKQAELFADFWTDEDIVKGERKEKGALFFNDIIPDTDMSGEDKFTTHLPVYSLEAVATSFGKEEYIEPLGWIIANIGKTLAKDMFVAKVIGRSMEPTIKDGSWCVFRQELGGSRNGKVVLVESRQITDPESHGRYTVKRYYSKKEESNDGTWQHTKIILSPDNKKFDDIVLESIADDDFRVVAEFVDILK